MTYLGVRQSRHFFVPENNAQPAGKPYYNSGGDVTGGDFEVISP